jgi:hypothetical protein
MQFRAHNPQLHCSYCIEHRGRAKSNAQRVRWHAVAMAGGGGQLLARWEGAATATATAYAVQCSVLGEERAHRMVAVAASSWI